MSIANLVGDLRNGYGGYPGDALFYFGWFLVVMIAVVGYLLQATAARVPGETTQTVELNR
jgi:NSS family neurotransmitter:Na+ symporter